MARNAEKLAAANGFDDVVQVRWDARAVSTSISLVWFGLCDSTSLPFVLLARLSHMQPGRHAHAHARTLIDSAGAISSVRTRRREGGRGERKQRIGMATHNGQAPEHTQTETKTQRHSQTFHRMVYALAAAQARRESMQMPFGSTRALAHPLAIRVRVRVRVRAEACACVVCKRVRAL
eukprot:1545444-Pleurochrysis_carterae.AAC.1